jgi:hypothetical protein
MTDQTANCKFYNAVPWSGYSILVIEPPASYSGSDTISLAVSSSNDVNTGISTITGVIGMKSGAIETEAWSGLTITLTSTGLTAILVTGK